MRINLMEYKGLPVTASIWTGAKEVTIFVPDPAEGGTKRVVLSEEEFSKLVYVDWEITKKE